MFFDETAVAWNIPYRKPIFDSCQVALVERPTRRVYTHAQEMESVPGAKDDVVLLVKQ